MINRDIFARDPLKMTIPNDGVAKLGEPSTKQEWDVLRYELENFVCDGEYERGLDKILSTYLANLDKTMQPAAWVSGFYGSGKSHLVRVLEFLWRDAEFPGGATARGLVNLPDAIREYLCELDTAGRRRGGLWSAAGTLDTGVGDSVRLAILGIVLRSARLPGRYAQGRFVLRLMQTGVYEEVRAGVEAEGQDFRTELANLYVSHHLRRSLLAVDPEFATNDAEARTLIRDQYPDRQEISEEEMLETMAEVLALASGDRENPPCTLLVLDELQQFIADNSDRTLQVQTAVEACSSRFGSRILFVATGQGALTATAQLSKLQGRYTVRVELSDTDVEEVVRQVVLRKAPAEIPTLRRVLDQYSGEIDRQLGGTNIAPSRADDAVLVADYPLLPARRRFWERVLRATDRAGSSSQLRAQLRIVLTATQEVAEDPLGTVIPADVLYEHIRPDMLQTGVLLREVDDTIREQRDGAEEGELRSRLCALIFLIGQLPTEPGADTGARATADTLADLLVQDLTGGSAPLRARIPELLGGLVESGTLMQVEGEYRLQTRESAEWTAAYQNAEARIRGDDARIAGDRAHELRLAVTEALRNIRFNQGASKETRSIELHFTADAPPLDKGAVPVWVRDEWSVTEKTVRDDARAAGPEDPVVHVFLPRRGPEEIKKAIAGYEAASEVLQGRPVPNTREGQEAYAAMETRQRSARASLDATIRSVLENARVMLGGGNEVVESSLRAAVEAAAWASLERLYPQFRVADDARWDTVIKRARQGSGDPLEPLGYEGDTDKHPVCSKVLSFVGVAGKRGREVREYFKAPPHGWPQDAIDGSLLALLSVGVLRATANGSPVTAKEVDQTRIGVAEFRAERSRPPSTLELIGVRKLLAEAGLDPRSGEELPAAHEFLGMMLGLAEAAGGDAPLPAPSNASYLTEIQVLSGNELLVAIHDNRERLRTDIAAWREAREEIKARTPRWERLRRLLEHARPLSGSEQLQDQADAIHQERALLEEPDPVPPLLNEVTDLLREAVTEAHRRYTEAFDASLRKLEGSGSWQSIDPSEQDLILGNHGLRPHSQPRLGNDAAVLDSLDATPLADWENSIDALPERFARANVEATKKLEPQAHRYRPPTATLKTREEVDEYLEGVKAEIMAHIDKGRPVVL